MPSITRSIHRGLFGFAAVLAMAGCSDLSLPTLPNFQSKGETTAFDGIWAGRFAVTVFTSECHLARGGLRMTIREGAFVGAVRQSGRTIDIEGRLTGDGQVERGQFFGEFASEDAEVTGQFSDNKAVGKWKSTECAGTWEVQRIGS